MSTSQPPVTAMASKAHPGEFDCYSNAKPDEPMFVLLARDPSAPTIVRIWTRLYEARKRAVQWGGLSNEQGLKVGEALRCADAMEAWAKYNPEV